MPVILHKFKSRDFYLLLSLLLLGSLLSACKASSATDTKSGDGAKSVTQSQAVAAHSPHPEDDHRPLIVALGDSLTAGYGLPSEQGWTALLQQRLDEKHLSWRVVNKGVSGDTSRGGLSRVSDAMQGDVKIMIVTLGGNDLLRGLEPEKLKQNLAEIIETAQARKVRIILGGMEAPPNLGDDYTSGIRNVYRELAKEYKVSLIPFFLAGVAGIADLNQPDGIHPNQRGQEIVLENVWQTLEPLLQ